MRRNQAVASYSVRDGFAERKDLDGMFEQAFRSERRCPRCGRCLNTNGHGAFRCPRCGFHDRQNVRKLYAAGLDYNFSAKHNSGAGLFGKRAAL